MPSVFSQLIGSGVDVCVQVSEGTVGLGDECVSGRRSELSAALLEVMQCYVGQAELLTEIQSLRSR